MSVIRRRHNKNFTVIGNEVFSDESLELDALGLLCYLRSRPHDWNIETKHLRRRFSCGPEKMQRLMRALQAAGWIVRQEAPRKPGGLYGGLEYVVLDEPDRGGQAGENSSGTSASRESENPLPVPESGQPTPGQPESVEPESDEPESDDPTPDKELDSTKGFSPLYPPVAGGTRSDEERISEKEALAGRRPERDISRRPRAERGCRGPAPPPASATPEARARFERLWAAYPLKGRLPADRNEALARFAALSPTEQEAAIRAASVEARERAETRSQPKALHRWLRDGKWTNAELALLPSAQPTRVFVRDGTPEWEAWAAHARRTGSVPKNPTWSEAERANGWWFPSALPPAAEVA